MAVRQIKFYEAPLHWTYWGRRLFLKKNLSRISTWWLEFEQTERFSRRKDSPSAWQCCQVTILKFQPFNTSPSLWYCWTLLFLGINKVIFLSNSVLFTNHDKITFLGTSNFAYFNFLPQFFKVLYRTCTCWSKFMMT